MEYLKAYYRVCRLEYAPGEIPAIFTVLFLGSATVSRFFALPVMEALLTFLLLYLSGFIINALADKEIDSKYDTFKTSIPKSVDILGESTLKAMIISHVTVGIVLAFHITIQMSSIWPIFLVLIGVFFGLGYSIKPFHFKVRGVWHAIALGSSAFFLPFVFLMYVVAQGLTVPLLLFIVGFSFVHYGMEFGNQAIDYVEDKASDVKTPPVRWGMIPSLIIALGCVVFGIIAEASSLYYILLSKGSFTYIHPMLTTNVVYVVLLSIILAGYYIPTKGLWKMVSTLKKSKTVEHGMPTLKKICNYAKWQTSGILGVAIVSAILFLGVTLAPVTLLSQNEQERTDYSESGLKIVSEPGVAFYEKDGICRANVSVSVLNGETPIERKRIMIEVESSVAIFSLEAKFLHLENDLGPYEYWNISTEILAHDVDDTTIKISLKGYNSEIKDFEQIGVPWIVHSKSDLYLYDVEVEYYDDLIYNEKAKVTAYVFNEKYSRDIGDLEVRVKCWTSYLLKSDEQHTKNNNTVKADENWMPWVSVDVYEVDPGNPIFEIFLYEQGEQIDYMKISK